jgi:signal transduction histidine kinase
MLEAIAYELAGRFGAEIVVDVAPDAVLAADALDQVGRIAREAIVNAARHGDARNILVSLKRTNDAFVLRVVDDGRGMAAAPDAPVEGFGIRSMRDRAAAVGGSLTIRPARASGTEVEVVFS